MSLVSHSLFLLWGAWAHAIPIVGPDGPIILGVSSHPEHPFYPSGEDHAFGYESIWVDWATGELVLAAEDKSGMIRRYREGGWQLPEVPDGFEYQNQRGQLLSVVDTRGGRWNYRYNNEGKIREIRWPNGGIIRIRYDEDGRVSQILGPSSERIDINWESRIQLDYSNGQSYRIDLYTEADREGYKVQDIYGRQLEVIQSGEEWQVIDPRGLKTLIETTNGRLTVQDINGSLWRFSQEDEVLSELYAPWGRQRWRKSEDELLISAPGGTSQINRYDKESRIQEQQFGLFRLHYSYNSAGLLRELRDSLGHTIYLGYDQAGQLRRLEDASGGVFFISRDSSGQVVEITGRSKQVWRIERDVMGRVKRIVTPEGITFVFQRNARGEVIAIEEAFVGVWTFDRDAMGHISRVILPQGAVYLLDRNTQGAVRRVVLPNKAQIQMSYDRMGWLSSITYGDLRQDILRDALGRVLRWGDHRLSYDSLGLVSEIDGWLKINRMIAGEIQSLDAGNYHLSVEYDLQGHPVRWSDDSGEWSLVRDSNGRIVQSSQPEQIEINRDPRGWINAIQLGELEWRFLRNASGAVLKSVMPSGDGLGFEQDDAQRLNWIRYPDGLMQRFDWVGRDLKMQLWGSDGRLLSEERMSYDDQCHIENIDQTNGAELFISYDSYGRLQQISSAEADLFRRTDKQILSREGTLIGFGEDGLTQSVIMTPPYLPYGSDQSTWWFQRDEAGNIDVLDAQSEAWFVERDELGRLSSLCSGIGCWSYRYSPVGLLSAISDPSGFWTPLIWDPQASDIGLSETSLMMHGAHPILAYRGDILVQAEGDSLQSLIYDVWGRLKWVKSSEDIQPVQQGVLKLIHGYEGLFGAACGFQPVANGPEFCGIQSQDVMSGNDLSSSRLNWIGQWHPAFEVPDNPSLRWARALQLIAEAPNHGWKARKHTDAVMWLSPQFESSILWDNQPLNRLAITQSSTDWWLTEILLNGESDPSSAELVAFFLQSERSLNDLDVWPVADSFWWFREDIFYPGLAHFSKMDKWHSSLWWE